MKLRLIFKFIKYFILKNIRFIILVFDSRIYYYLSVESFQERWY
jgi:hypothetical protein